MITKFIPQYEPSYTPEQAEALKEYILGGGWCSEHIKTRELEEQIASYLGKKHCIMVNNGTVAISIALHLAGIKKGDFVIVPGLSMIATANAVRFIGAQPLFVDIEPNSLCLDPEKALTHIRTNKKIKGVVYVSFNGRWNRDKRLTKLISSCNTKGVIFMEDNAQAFGSQCYKGMIGCVSDVSTYSFSPHKIISMGQGGCITTDDNVLASNIRKYKDFGRTTGGMDYHEVFGMNFKVTDLQAILALEQLKHIEELKAKKKQIYSWYTRYLQKMKKVARVPTNLELTTPWFVDMYSQRRNELQSFLKNRNIGSRIMYPPMYSQPCYNLQNKSLPVTELYSQTGLWLPSSFNLTEEQVSDICLNIREFFTLYGRAI